MFTTNLRIIINSAFDKLEKMEHWVREDGTIPITIIPGIAFGAIIVLTCLVKNPQPMSNDEYFSMLSYPST
jgi:hypothetical protein